MNCSTPVFPVFHCLPEFAQAHAHWVGDVTYSMINIINAAVCYLWKSLSLLEPKSSYYKNLFYSSFCFYCIHMRYILNIAVITLQHV